MSTKKLTTEEFIKKAIQKYGDKYSYNKTNYTNNRTKVTITCPEHGDFDITPTNFLQGHTCSGCSKGNSLKDFVEKAKKVHNDKYSYNQVVYTNGRTSVTIVCPSHGAFQQTPINHIAGAGCPQCAIENRRKSLKDFIEESNRIHSNKYNYSKVNYINNRTKVVITCPEHGDFSQIPSDHLRGVGCPACSDSQIEKEIRQVLLQNSIVFEEQKTWDWLIYKSNQYVDFYLPEYNIVIEGQGIQHFEPIDFFGGEEKFNLTVDKDKNKLKLCEDHHLRVLYYSNLGPNYTKYPNNIIYDLNDLMKNIKTDAD